MTFKDLAPRHNFINLYLLIFNILMRFQNGYFNVMFQKPKKQKRRWKGIKLLPYCTNQIYIFINTNRHFQPVENQ